MGLSYGARRRWSLMVLVLGLPAYIVAAISIVGLFARPPVLLELGMYAGLGVLWAVPLRFVFRGVGRARPEEGAD